MDEMKSEVVIIYLQNLIDPFILRRINNFFVFLKQYLKYHSCSENFNVILPSISFTLMIPHE